jgi:hypothetical protein
MRRLVLVCCTLWQFSGFLLAQGPDLQFELCVKQFDEFRDRFNGRHLQHADTLNAPPPPDRTTLLLSLMGKDMDKATAEAFITSVVGAEPAFELMLDNQPWFAHVTCMVSDTTMGYPIQFWLVREKKGLARKWSILSSDMRQENGSPKPFIHSRNHETGFTDLLKADLLAQYGVAPYVGPPGIQNLFALQEGLLGGVWTIDEVAEVRMYLLQVPGWFVEVGYRPPPASEGWITSGWNVIHLEPMSDVQKTMYIWRDVLGL